MFFPLLETVVVEKRYLKTPYQDFLAKLKTKYNQQLFRQNLYQEDTYYKIPLKKWTTPEEIADAVLYLSSDSAISITGVNLVIDNGALLLSDKAERYGL